MRYADRAKVEGRTAGRPNGDLGVEDVFAGWFVGLVGESEGRDGGVDKPHDEDGGVRRQGGVESKRERRGEERRRVMCPGGGGGGECRGEKWKW